MRKKKCGQALLQDVVREARAFWGRIPGRNSLLLSPALLRGDAKPLGPVGTWPQNAHWKIFALELSPQRCLLVQHHPRYLSRYRFFVQSDLVGEQTIMSQAMPRTLRSRCHVTADGLLDRSPARSSLSVTTYLRSHAVEPGRNEPHVYKVHRAAESGTGRTPVRT